MRLLRGAAEVALARDGIRLNNIAANWKPAPRRSALPDSGPGRRMPAARSWCSGRSTPRRFRCCSRRCAKSRAQQSRYETAEEFMRMAIAHKALGDDETAAADATAESIYVASSVSSRRPVDPAHRAV